MTDMRQVLQEAEKLIERLRGSYPAGSHDPIWNELQPMAALIRASLAEGDPVPEASVLTRSEPSEADVQAACTEWTERNMPFGSQNALHRTMRAVVRLIWLRAQAALPVPADRSGEWQTIETAPKDGRNVLLWWPYWFTSAVVGRYMVMDGGWWAEAALTGGVQPTHWMPLPGPPILSLKGEGK